ncbi:MAG: regulatory iron-sulfur-containing complex subunit RicT [Lentimicrobiaceae bacterium]|nr:regulatory iron-sulfur-containing complex subunit RicT [Lentimicrobiaceae bacterium]
MDEQLQIKFSDSKESTKRGWNTQKNPLIRNKINESACSKLSARNWLDNIPTSETDTENYAEIRFKNDHKDFFIIPDNLNVYQGDIVAVEANYGHDIGIVTLTKHTAKLQILKKNAKTSEFKKIYRKATQKDIDKWLQAISREKDALIFTRKTAEKLGLEMKVNDVEFQGDGCKAIFYYTADERIDFRELIKILAEHLKIRIEMKQIGIRQEAAHIGGIGPCGRELCCCSWMNTFRTVSTNSAKVQQLTTNPQKLAGQCSKLKCCLNYEVENYAEAIKDFPSPKTIIKTKLGDAYIQKFDVLNNKVWLAYKENIPTLFPVELEDVNEIIEKNKQDIIIEALDDWKIVESDEKRYKDSKDIKQVELLDDIDRFDKKKQNRSKKKRNRNKNRNKKE